MSTHEEALEELRELAHEIRCHAEQSGYGYFPGGDPREFSPDPEASTAEEQRRHKDACAAWERGERPQFPPHTPIVDDDGKQFGHLTHGHFGLGVYTMVDEEAAHWADVIERALERLGRTNA